jgi:hypothetical protein
LPEVSWPFFKAVRAGLAVTKPPYLNHTGRVSNAEKRPTDLRQNTCYFGDRALPRNVDSECHARICRACLRNWTISCDPSGDPLSYEKAQETSIIIAAINATRITPSLDRRIVRSAGGAPPASSRLNGVPLTASTKRKSFTPGFYSTGDTHTSGKKASAKNEFIQIMIILETFVSSSGKDGPCVLHANEGVLRRQLR